MKHQSLPRDHIRVLDIASKEEGEHIRCSVRVLDLREEHPLGYTALSYVWGDFTNYTVQCDGEVVRVSDSCYSALWHLREELGKFTVWIDALCIDQDNTEEKQIQIPMMGAIYSKARKVYIWLGPATGTSERIIQYLAEHGTHIFHCKPRKRSRSSFLYGIGVIMAGNESRRKQIHIRAVTSDGTTLSIYRFLGRLLLSTFHPGRYIFPLGLWSDRLMRFPWFKEHPYVYIHELREFLQQLYIRRIWTYQEVLFATNPVLVCGRSHLGWDDFACAMLFLSGAMLSDLDQATDPWEKLAFDRAKLHRTDLETYEDLTRTGMSIYIKLVLGFLQSGLMLGALLIVIGTALLILQAPKGDYWLGTVVTSLGFAIGLSFMAADALWAGARYALVLQPQVRKSSAENMCSALINRGSTNPLDMAYAVWAILQRRGASLSEPRYDRPMVDVYYELTVQLLQVTQSFDFLHLATVSSVQGGPSWVPDWHVVTTEHWSLPQTGTENRYRWRRWFYVGSRELDEVVEQEGRVISWSFDGKALIVPSHDVGMVTASLALYWTTDKYEEYQRGLHIHNFNVLRSLLTDTADRPAILVQFAMLFENVATKTAMIRSCMQELRTDRSTWEERPDWFRNHLAKWCYKAGAECRICTVRIDGRDCVALCNAGEVGDRVVRIKSMSTPVTVRDAGSDGAVRLIGPYIPLYGQWWNTATPYKAGGAVFQQLRIH